MKIDMKMNQLALALAVISLVGLGFIFYDQYYKPVPKHNYAVLDIDDAISKTTIRRLRDTTDPEETKKIMRGGRAQVEDWLMKRLEFYCAAPCVVFNRKDVVFGDVTDLNKMYEIEALGYKR
jgi:hypothetical protein